MRETVDSVVTYETIYHIRLIIHMLMKNSKKIDKMMSLSSGFTCSSTRWRHHILPFLL